VISSDETSVSSFLHFFISSSFLHFFFISSFLHFIDVIPTRSITEEPGFVRAHKAAADVIAGAHRTVLAEIDASDASEESKSVDRTYLADSIQSQYRALAE